jgi:hypothetical protein
LTGEYCIKSKFDGKQGTCQSYEKELVGQPCNVDAAQGAPEFCGKVMSYETAKGALVNTTEWAGICDNHVCNTPVSKRAKLCLQGKTDFLSSAKQTTAVHDKLKIATPEIMNSGLIQKVTEQPTKGNPTMAGDQAKGMMGSGTPISSTPPSIDVTTAAKKEDPPAAKKEADGSDQSTVAPKETTTPKVPATSRRLL